MVVPEHLKAISALILLIPSVFQTIEQVLASYLSELYNTKTLC
jgi:hypothetical protein